jgi:hypothetical protein
MKVAAWRWMFATLVLTAAAWVTVTRITEAFGAGPPYYSRTTNMDKWENPTPMLVAVDLTALVVVGMLLAARPRRGSSSSS